MILVITLGSAWLLVTVVSVVSAVYRHRNRWKASVRHRVTPGPVETLPGPPPVVRLEGDGGRSVGGVVDLKHPRSWRR